jgi:ABC-type multidrug transport system fused ATPase/permease subunit
MSVKAFDYGDIVPPKNLKDVPRFLKELLGNFFGRFLYILKLVWDTGWWILVLMSLVALVNGFAPVIGSLLSREITNELQIMFGKATIADFFGSRVFRLIIFVLIYRIVKDVMATVSTAVDRISGELVVKQIRLQIMEKSKELDLGFFDLPEFYEKLENANREAGMRPIQVLSQTFSLISKVIELISYAAVLLTAPKIWYAVPILLVIAIPSAVINFVYRRKNFRYLRGSSKERREMNYYSSTLVNKDLVKEIRIFDLTDTFVGRFSAVFKEYFKGLKNLILSESLLHILVGIVSAVATLCFYAMLAAMTLEGKLLIGDYILYTGAVMSVSMGVGSLIYLSANIYEGTLFIDNLMFFMKEKPTLVSRIDNPIKVTRGAPHTVEFKNVSFSYPGFEKPVLKNINLKFEAGQTTVLVGLNGAGKTTLVKLLTRLYDPTEGEILLDGRDLRDYDIKDLYHAFGIIFQDYGKYAVTVGENITFGDLEKTPTAEDIKTAAIQSNANVFIEKLEKGYDTPLTRWFEKEGAELSIGQWQKLAIARAFYADSEILILDEPTAALDAIAEQEIFNQFDELRQNKMTVFVSHRLSSATDAGQIIVLQNGSVAESGTHRELMNKKGKYYDLFTTQAKRYLETENEE